MSFVGAQEYLASEIVWGGGHGSGVDWWTLGIFIFELFYGVTPFRGNGNEPISYARRHIPQSPLPQAQPLQSIAHGQHPDLLPPFSSFTELDSAQSRQPSSFVFSLSSFVIVVLSGVQSLSGKLFRVRPSNDQDWLPAFDLRRSPPRFLSLPSPINLASTTIRYQTRAPSQSTQSYLTPPLSPATTTAT
ncbi:hypothetical protein RJ639_033335 [Escallonia herrerae]|uniref:non-specific serine/threonine protein kinase n=1 Tax=Escallonia herrerae TaxID=1293975 RepID=A0AA88WW82_9ASTE|nr:hypothetical protein RJ639_033335 [Escallonia herrerae]